MSHSKVKFSSGWAEQSGIAVVSTYMKDELPISKQLTLTH